MGLISFEEAIRSVPKDKVFITDTCFIINAQNEDSKEFELVKKFAGKVGFAFNVIIRKEILHLTRYQMVANAIEKDIVKVHPRIKKLWDISNDHERLKRLCEDGYAELFREILGSEGQLLQGEVERILAGFMYVDGRKNSNSSGWNQVNALMATYGLDSSDAMILNFAVGDATFSGVITSDSDFRVCGDVKSKNSFDIILPKKAKDRTLKKNWRPDPK